MMKSNAAFVVYGVHKDGLLDPAGQKFIDEGIIETAKRALKDEGVALKEETLVVATKAESKDVFCALAKDDAIDCLVLFTGTWVWAAHMVAALRQFAMTGKGIVIWTHDGSQGWRPVGGLVLHGGLSEIGIQHKFVYGGVNDPANVRAVASYCRAAAVKNAMNMKTLMAFGGRGMGQTCGVADPSQWMKTFGIDIDSRDTYELLENAKNVPQAQIDEVYAYLDKIMREKPERIAQNERSIRLYCALRNMHDAGAFDFYTIQSFPGMGDYYTATCFAQSMMLDNGVPTSTLGDFNTCMSAILLTWLGDEPVYYGDLQHIDKANKEIKIIGDGAIPPSLANEDGPELASHGIPTEGSAGGMSINVTAKPGKGVLARLSRVNGKFIMPIARCEISVPEDAAERRNECGIPFWPHAFVTVDGDIDKLVQVWNNEYACLGYGEHLYEELIDFCALTGIEAIPV